jgi:hypothetical protein
MPDEQLPINASTLDLQSILKELEVPFSPNQVQWRVTNTAKDRKRATGRALCRSPGICG